MKVKTESGLDAGTAALIQKLPEEVRKQVIGALSEALPLIDQSVLKYLDKVHEITKSIISSAACELAGATKETLTSVARDAVGRSDKDWIGDVTELRGSTIGSFRENTPPDVIRIGYAKILTRAYFNRCVVTRIPEAVSELQRIADEARMRWVVWERMSDRACRTADACYKALLVDTRRIVDSAETRICLRSTRSIE